MFFVRLELNILRPDTSVIVPTQLLKRKLTINTAMGGCDKGAKDR